MSKPVLSSLVGIAIALSATANASLYEQSSSPARQSEWQWFLGVTTGYSFEYDEPIYTGNFGVISPWSPMGWSTSFFFEGGRIEDDNESEIPLGVPGGNADLQIVPLTLNVKFERALTDHVGVYFGAGAGAVFTELIPAGGERDQDTQFTAQFFAGFNFYLGESSEINLGGRFIHFDNTDNYRLADTYVVELGYRYKF